MLDTVFVPDSEEDTLSVTDAEPRLLTVPKEGLALAEGLPDSMTEGDVLSVYSIEPDEVSEDV